MEMKAGRQWPRPPEASTVVAYDPAWPHFFRSMRERLQDLFVGSEALIEHVGSTAVPGLAAKPIVDIDVVVPSSPDIPDAVCRLESGGSIHRDDLGIPGREAFDVPPDLPYHHLYVVDAGTKPHPITCSFATTSAATPMPPSATDDGSWRSPTSSPLRVVGHTWRPRHPSSRGCSRSLDARSPRSHIAGAWRHRACSNGEGDGA